MLFHIEKIWKTYENKYKAINVAALFARKLKGEQSEGKVDKSVNHIKETLSKLTAGKIKYKE
jgi:hypothetical protein